METTVPASAPETQTTKVSAVDAAVIASGESLSEGIAEFREARRAERTGTPKDQVEIQTQTAADGTVTAVDPKVTRREERRVKQEAINEGARKAAGRVVEDYEAKIAAEKTRADRLEAELAALRRPAPVAEPIAPAKPAPVALAADPNDPEPDPANAEKYPGGEYDPKYLREAAAWDARQFIRQQEATARQRTEAQQATQSYQASLTGFRERMETAKKADPEFEKAIDGRLTSALVPTAEIPRLIAEKILPADYQPTPANFLADLVVRSLVAPQVLRHLSEHPDEYVRILNEGPLAFARLEGVFLHQQTTTAPAPVVPPKLVTSAPAPPQTLGETTTSPADPIAKAVADGKDNLTGGVRAFRAARLNERLAAQGRR